MRVGNRFCIWEMEVVCAFDRPGEDVTERVDDRAHGSEGEISVRTFTKHGDLGYGGSKARWTCCVEEQEGSSPLCLPGSPAPLPSRTGQRG